jgi:hypothetical protein
MSKKTMRMVTFGTLVSASSLSWAISNECLVSIGIVGSNVVGVHDINVNTPTYDVWVFTGTLKRNGLEVDFIEIVSPDDGPEPTSATKINCLLYSARTDAQIDGPSVPDFFCNITRTLTPDTRPPTC